MFKQATDVRGIENGTGEEAMKFARFFWRYVNYRKDLGMALLGCTFAFFQRHRSGELLHRVTADVRLFSDFPCIASSSLKWIIQA